MRGILNYIHHMILKYDIIHFLILFRLGEILKYVLKCLVMLQSPKINITRNWFLQRRVPLHIMICYVGTLCSFGRNCYLRLQGRRECGWVSGLCGKICWQGEGCISCFPLLGHNLSLMHGYKAY